MFRHCSLRVKGVHSNGLPTGLIGLIKLLYNCPSNMHGMCVVNIMFNKGQPTLGLCHTVKGMWSDAP